MVELPKGEGTGLGWSAWLVGAGQPKREGAARWVGGSGCYWYPGLVFDFTGSYGCPEGYGGDRRKLWQFLSCVMGGLWGVILEFHG